MKPNFYIFWKSKSKNEKKFLPHFCYYWKLIPSGRRPFSQSGSPIINNLLSHVYMYAYHNNIIIVQYFYRIPCMYCISLFLL